MRAATGESRARLGAVVTAYAVLFAMGLADNARGPAYPRILQHFGIAASVGSFMFTAASVGSVLVSWTGRTWLTRFGAAKAVRVFAAILSAACVGMGLVGFSRAGVAGLVGVSLAFGVGATGCSMCANSLVADGGDPAHRRRLLSGLHSTYGASSLLAPIVVAACGRLGLDWRCSFFALAAAPFLAGAVAVIARPADAIRAPSLPAPPAASPPGAGVPKTCLVLALYVAAEIAISTRLPLLAERHFGWGRDAAALCLSAFFALLLAGRLAFALLHFRVASARLLVLSAGVSLAAYLVGLFVHPAGLAACGLTMSFFFPTAIDWIRAEHGDGWQRVLASAVAAVGVALVVMHFAVGVLTDVVGIRDALLVGPACLVALLLLLARQRR